MSMDTTDELEDGNSVCCPKRCTGSCSEPVAKRTRLSLQQLNETIKEEDHSDERTILDMLNEDCWRVLLGYVDVEQLVLSERVSKHWRLVVQQYLQGITLCLRSSRYYREPISKPTVKCRELWVPPKYYLGVVERFGRAIVVADCFDAAGLKSLGANCPDLEDLKIQERKFHQVKNVVVHFKKLKRVTFRDVLHLQDAYVSKFLKVNTPNELVIANNVRITGICLTSLKTNLKSLGLHLCGRLDIIYLLLASHRLADLTKLRINCNSSLVLEDVYLLINKTPKLKYLSLAWYNLFETVDVGGLVDAICRLSSLKHIRFHDNDSVMDEWLEPIGRCCKELRVVDIGGCIDVTAAGVDALCRGASETLAALDVSGNDNITDEDVIRWIYMCPKLEILDVHFCMRLTPELVPACKAAVVQRPRPLRLRLCGTTIRLKIVISKDDDYDKQVETYSNLILDFRIGYIDYSDYLKKTK